ncbi:MAG: VanZ family protein [Desulfitobacteriaceae bacterium]
MIKGISLDSGFALVAGILLWIVIRSFVLFKNKRYNRFSVQREILINIFAVYVVLLISITLFPINIIWDEVIEKSPPAVNIIPFVDILTDFPRTQFSMAFKIEFLIKNLIGNLLLLLSIGIFLPTLWIKVRSFWKMLMIGASASLTIEMLQYVSAYLGYGWGRAADVDDLILNTLGVIIGYRIFYKILIRLHVLSRSEMNIKAD